MQLHTTTSAPTSISLAARSCASSNTAYACLDDEDDSDADGFLRLGGVPFLASMGGSGEGSDDSCLTHPFAAGGEEWGAGLSGTG